jgi:hypothetical protein
VFPDPRVINFISQNFIPVKVHIKEQPQNFERFGAQWTPTEVLLDPDGTERYRFEGFLPAEDFLAHLQTGLARSAFERQHWQEAERLYRQVVEQFPNTELAPAALYWAGVSRYKATGNAAALGETAGQFKKRYTDSTWAKKASVWAA